MVLLLFNKRKRVYLFYLSTVLARAYFFMLVNDYWQKIQIVWNQPSYYLDKLGAIDNKADGRVDLTYKP